MRLLRLVLPIGIYALFGAAQLTAANLPAAYGSQELTLIPEGVKTSPDSAFGETWNYFNPFLSLGEYYTDNLFNTENNQQSDFVTVITPGIWFALPASRQPLLDVETVNTVPGGFELTRFDTDLPRRMQAYALYRANINRHNDFSQENTVNHRAEGRLQYNLRGGLSLELLDIYEIEQDPYSTGTSQTLDEFKSNVLIARVEYRITPKTRVRTDFSLYSLSYDANLNRFRDRDDQGFSLFAFHKFWDKTSAFLEYEYVSIDYDRNFLVDSKEHHYFAGLVWDATEKIAIQGKVGYGVKSFDTTFEDNEDMIGEARVDYRFTPKTSLGLTATRAVNESDILGMSDVLTHRVGINYAQRITAKIRLIAEINYLRNKYRGGNVISGPLIGERVDDHLGGGLTLGFSLRDWLNLSAGYNYVERDSNFSTYNYQTNTFYFTLTAAL